MNLSVVYKETKSLIPYIGNAKQHEQQQIDMIAASISEFGFNNPILLDGNNGIIAGHGRLQAAQKLNLTDVPTIDLSHLSDAKKKAYIIADNRLSEVHTSWDLEILSSELESIKFDGLDIDLTGFDDSFIIEEKPDNNLGDEDDVPELPSNPVTVLGDVWVMGKHRVKCGDSLNENHAKDLMLESNADLFLTDPPYNINYEGGSKLRESINNDNLSNDDFRRFLYDAFSVANLYMNPGAVFYIWHADSEGYNFRGACFDVKWKPRQCLIWNKNNSAFGRQDYHWKHEPCLYGWKDGAAHYWSNDRKQTTILEYDRPSRSDSHPTMKPVDLFEYQITNNTKENDIVLDLFGGSGTTVIACEKSNRRSRVMELDPYYCDVIIKRWQDYTVKQATLEGDGRTFNEIAEERLNVNNG